MAYGVNAPFGFRPIASLSGGTWTEKTNTYYIYARPDGLVTYDTSLFTGDLVQWNPTAASVIAGYPTIARTTIDNATVLNEQNEVLGVFWGCEYYDVNNNLVKAQAWPANTLVYPGTQIKAFIIDDPNVFFEVQASTSTNVANNARFGGTTNTAATAAYFGQNYAVGLGGGGGNLVPNNPASGNFGSGLSAMYLNIIATGAGPDRTNAQLPLKAISYSTDPRQFNNIYEADGTTARQFLTIVVSINNHVFSRGNGGVTPA